MSKKDKTPYRAHLFICNGKSCSQMGDPEKTKAYFKEKIKEHGLKGKVRACTASCFDLCDDAPNVLVHPDGTWYSHVEEKDWKDILEHHILNKEMS